MPPAFPSRGLPRCFDRRMPVVATLKFGCSRRAIASEAVQPDFNKEVACCGNQPELFIVASVRISGHSSDRDRITAFAPFATFAGSSRIKRSNSNRSFEPAPASVGGAWQLPQLFFEMGEIDRLRDELGSA